jgi:predicted TIM-barrel fold metal-dependent hydrolase
MIEKDEYLKAKGTVAKYEEQLNIHSVSESIITDIDTLAHDYNHKIDVAGNTDVQNIIAEAKRDALDEALLIIKRYSR